MKRSLFVLPLLILAACGEADKDILDPVVAESLSLPAPTAVVTVDGSQYTIGCPYFPCPVTKIVVDQITARRYFWFPPGTFTYPTIYLSVLETAVQLQPGPTGSILPPPPPPTEPVPPELTGPLTVQGFDAGLAQVACNNYALTLNSPDNGPWDFVSGDIVYDYVKWNPTTNQWVETGQSSIVPFSYVSWDRMQAGTFQTIGLLGGLDYYATFMVTLKRGTFQTTVSHRMLCARQNTPPVVVPPAPSLDGPTQYMGTRPNPSVGNLVCTGIGVSLISPDNGSWDFVSGERVLDLMVWDPSKRKFVHSSTRTDPLTLTDWQQLLAGTYKIDLQTRTGPYFFTFNVVVERGSYQHTISHTAGCGGQDFLEMGT